MVALREVVEGGVGQLVTVAEGHVAFGVSHLVHAFFIDVMTLQFFLKR